MTKTPEDITLEAALDLLKSATPPRADTEEVSINNALHRILHEDVISTINVPQNDTAAVDGYGFFHDDLSKDALPVIGSIKAGHPYEGQVERGKAYRIFTGAPMPEGLDTVAMQEHCSLNNDGEVILPASIKKNTNFRPKGENASEGEVVLKRGTRMGPAEIGLAAAIGRADVLVATKLKIAIISMGDEVVDIGMENGFTHGMTHDSNRPMLKQLMMADGHEVLDFGICGDDRDALTAVFKRAADEADVILSSGGSSDGEEDHARNAIIDNDGHVDFWRLALKPGRPMAAGRISQKPIYCVPGNPVAAFVCTRLLVCPMLTHLQGGIDNPPLKISCPSGFAHRHRKGRTEYLRARLESGDGEGRIVLNGRRGAGVLSSLTYADGLVEIPADHDDVKEGDMLPFLILREAGL